MSWAAGRRTTREEDRAYSLMGIFDVHMPMLYGEGEFAFVRLQEELIKRSDDQSIFAWRTLHGRGNPILAYAVGVLAPHPDVFKSSGNIVRHKISGTKPFSITNKSCLGANSNA